MPLELAKISALRPGWLMVMGLLALSVLRKWQRSKVVERPVRNSGSPSKGAGKGSSRASQGKGWQQASKPSSEKGNGKVGSSRSSAGVRHPEVTSPALPGASEAEMGPEWHCEGRRRWSWMHDGVKPNGWIEFCANGIVRTSLCTDGRGTWERLSNGDMLVTFGRCIHILALLPEAQGQPAMFELRERVMRDGSPLSQKRIIPTKGRLGLES